MAPNAPDSNPIKHVWKDTKESIANWQAATFGDTLDVLETQISTPVFDSRI